MISSSTSCIHATIAGGVSDRLFFGRASLFDVALPKRIIGASKEYGITGSMDLVIPTIYKTVFFSAGKPNQERLTEIKKPLKLS